MEQRYGSLRTLLFYVVVGVGSAAAEHAFFRGGVGLSGIGYGIVGFLSVAHRHDPKLADAMDSRTARLFVIWFFFCIGLTVTNILPVANVAHGVGFFLGALSAMAVATKRGPRVAWAGATTALLLVSLLCSAWLRPLVNIGEGGGLHAWSGAQAAYEAHDYAESERLYEYACSVDGDDARLWFNLGATRQAMGALERARTAYERAADLAPNEPRYVRAAEALRSPAAPGRPLDAAHR
jgi:hypothetical protein